MKTRERQRRHCRSEADVTADGSRSRARLARGLDEAKGVLRRLEDLLKDPRVRLAAATLAVHFARLAKRRVRKFSKKRGSSKALRSALQTLVEMARETATNWLIGSPDDMVGKDRKRARKLRDRVALRSSAA
jgi:hypothetical protein